MVETTFKFATIVPAKPINELLGLFGLQCAKHVGLPQNARASQFFMDNTHHAINPFHVNLFVMHVHRRGFFSGLSSQS